MEKERYRFNVYNDHIAYFYDNGVRVKTIITIYDVEKLLNQQDTKIKELEEENQQLKEKLLKFLHRISDQNEEILQLKQSQNHKAIEELEKVKEWIKSVDESGYIFPFRDMDTREKFNQKLDNQIKKLRGGENG